MSKRHLSNCCKNTTMLKIVRKALDILAGSVILYP